MCVSDMRTYHTVETSRDRSLSQQVQLSIVLWSRAGHVDGILPRTFLNVWFASRAGMITVYFLSHYLTHSLTHILHLILLLLLIASKTSAGTMTHTHTHIHTHTCYLSLVLCEGSNCELRHG